MNMREYVAIIGERTLRVNGRNVWEAAERAAVHFGSRWLEGLQFFRGTADMALWRVGMDRPVFSGSVDKWLQTFRAQQRSVARWERVQGRAA
jgi:hypothetical protein